MSLVVTLNPLLDYIVKSSQAYYFNLKKEDRGRFQKGWHIELSCSYAALLVTDCKENGLQRHLAIMHQGTP